MTPERAQEIIKDAQSRPGAKIGPWSDQLKHVMTEQEHADVMAKWETMCYVDALLRIAKNED